MTATPMNRPSVVEALNTSEGFWLAGLAREVWPLARHYLSDLKPEARKAVEHYRDHLTSCPLDGCEGCRT